MSYDRKSRRKSVSPIVVTLLLILVVVVASVFMYSWIKGMMGEAKSSSSQAVNTMKNIAMIEWARVYDIGKSYSITLAIRNIGDPEIIVDSIFIKEPGGELHAFKTISKVRIKPGDVAIVTASVPKDELKVRPGETLSVWAGCSNAVTVPTTLKASDFLEAPELVVYLINITSIGGNWGNPSLLYSALESKAIIKTISSMSELDNLVRNPPDYAVIINCHDEVVPIPPSWGGDWYSYFRAIGRNIRDHGWIWVSLMGYPFYYVNDGTSKVTIGENGVAAVLSVVGGSARFWSGSSGVITASATSVVPKVEQATGIDLPDALVDAPRQADFVSGVQPQIVFYEHDESDKTYYAAAAYRLGRGFLIVNGLGGGEPADDIARIAAATALYTRISQPPAPSGSSNARGIYLVAIPSVWGSWVAADNDLSTPPGTASEYYEAARQLSQRTGVSSTVFVDSLTKLKNLVLSGPERVVVINMHGEALPVPDEWWSNGGSSPQDFVSNYTLEGMGVSELHAVAPSTGSASFTLYKSVVDTRPSANALRLSILVAPLSPCHSFGVGFTSVKDISNTGGRVFEVEVRLQNNDISNPIDLVVWHNNSVVMEHVLEGVLNTHSWYNLTLTIYDNDTVKLEVRGRDGSLLYEYSSMASPGYNSVNYACIGLWGVNSGVHDASYLVGRVSLEYLGSDGHWHLVFDVSGDKLPDNMDFNLVEPQGSGPRWRAWMGLIAWNIWRHGWAWCNIKGYPLYYVANEASRVTVSANGWNFMRFLLNISLDKLNVRSTTAYGDALPTSWYNKLQEALAPPKWIQSALAPRPISDTSGVDRAHVYYMDPSSQLAPVVAVRAGKGVFVDCGLGGSYAVDHGCMALALAVALAELG